MGWKGENWSTLGPACSARARVPASASGQSADGAVKDNPPWRRPLLPVHNLGTRDMGGERVRYRCTAPSPARRVGLL